MGSQTVAILDYAMQFFSFFLYLSLIVTVYAKMIAGYVNIITSGGNGKPGQK